MNQRKSSGSPWVGVPETERRSDRDTAVLERAFQNVGPRRLRLFLSLLAFLIAADLNAHGAIHEQILRVTQLIQQNPQDAALYIKRGELYRVHEDWSAALEDYRQAEVIAPELDTRAAFLRGILYFQSGEYNKAVTALDVFLSQEPLHAEGLIARARARVRLGKTTDAIKDYDRALSSIKSPKPGHYVERAEAVASQGPSYRRHAIEGLDQGIETVGPVVTLLLSAIELELADEHYDAALTRLDRIIAQAQRKGHWVYRRGAILEQAGRADEARKAYAEALSSISALTPPHRRSSRTSELETKLRAKLKDLNTLP